MKRIKNGEGKFCGRGYIYHNWEVYCVGYHSPDQCVWWEAVNITTGDADFHATTKKHIKRLIDQDLQK